MDSDESKSQQAVALVNGFVDSDPPPRADIDEILRRKRKAREYKVRQAQLSPVALRINTCRPAIHAAREK